MEVRVRVRVRVRSARSVDERVRARARARARVGAVMVRTGKVFNSSPPNQCLTLPSRSRQDRCTCANVKSFKNTLKHTLKTRL